MRTDGRTVPFRAREWDDVAAFLEEMVGDAPAFRHMSDVVDSVRRSGAADLLACTTWMHDLLVVTTPVPEPPYAPVIVRAPSSMVTPQVGEVIVEHTSLTGRREVVARPVAHAVPLFWRFAAEKLGVTPASRPPR